ncbi:MAG TPA: S9 family peptidase [Candidatus Acidoferrum sp.]|nr:S9 family peptidase [Candidatus Acidoferrum sp.]
MKCSLLRIGLLFVLAIGGTARAQEKAADAGTAKLLTPEASLTLRTISDLQFSPDETRVAFVVTEPPKGDRRARHIWLYDKKSGSVRQFTFSPKDESAPRWSPDGKQLAFLSNRDEQQQVYVLRMEGGEASAVTRGKRGVQNFAWSPDGKQIAFLAPDAKTDSEEKKDKDKDDAHLVDKEDKHARLWLLTLATSEAKALTDAKWEVSEIAWLPAGDRIVVSATDHPESDEETHRIFSVAVADGSRKLLLAPHGPFSDLRVSPDGMTVSFVGCRVDGPVPYDLMLLDIGRRATRNLTGASLDRGVHEHRWIKDGSVLAVYGDGFRNKFAGFSPDGMSKNPENPAAGNVAGFAVSDSGEVAFVGQSATTPQELWVWDQKKAPRQVSHLNDSWKQFALSTPEIYKYKSFDGSEIEAALLKPAGADGKSRLPLIALIHGGPTGNWQDSIETWGQLLATHGYAVFYPNIRGSSGYGQQFVEMNRGDWGGADFKDVMAGVKDLIDRGIADPARMGIGGWSYGGYMAEWAVTQTNDFKAAVSGAGLSNLISEYGSEQHPSYDEWFYGVPYEPDSLVKFLNSSPFTQVKNAKKPTLILQGDADTTDPLDQSQELYRGLKHYGVETELVVYPREPHGLREEKHLLDRLNRILAWFDKYVK